LETQSDLRKKLKENIAYFNEHAKSSHWGPSKTAIQTFFIAGNKAVKKKALEIQENRKNTTIYYLMDSFNITYLTQDKNHYLQQNIDYIEIHNKFNQYQEPHFNSRSITSLIKRK
jgi:7-keto-8-aminopelargonate synthetase-like enzyme